jgi:GGDEF domain-containing protein
MPPTDPMEERSGTNLPAGALVEHLLRARLKSGKPLAVLLIDLTNFEVYNSEYGWAQGDRVIQMLAQTISAIVTTLGGKDDVIGHIWGDQFVVVSTPDHAEHIAQQIIKRFDAAIPQYYSPEVRDHHYIDGLDRRGNPFRALMTCVAIAIVTNEQHPLEHPLQIEELGAEVRKYIKSWPGSNYAFDRRLK